MFVCQKVSYGDGGVPVSLKIGLIRWDPIVSPAIPEIEPGFPVLTL